jgi:hypothetical protein
VHRNGDADGLGPAELVSIKLLDGEIDAPNPMPGGLQAGRLTSSSLFVRQRPWRRAAASAE